MEYKYIIIEGKNDYKCNRIEDVVRKLVDQNYYELSEIEKKEAIKRKATANILGKNLYSKENYLSDFILDNEITYILSLLKMEIIYLLEHRDKRELTLGIDLPNDSKNYVIVNSYAQELLKNIKNKKSINKKNELKKEKKENE